MNEVTSKDMKLYHAVDRIHRDLRAEGFGRTDALPLEVLTRFDQLHYFGTDAVDEAAEVLNVQPGARVLDIGSGFGGPARYFADRTRAQVDAVELQADLNETAADLTARTALNGTVQHVCGDILTVPLDPESLDGAFSYLALYHIPGREPLFPRLHAAMKPGAAIYVEDLYSKAPLNEKEATLMREALFGNTLPDRDAYAAELSDAGFTDIDFQDQSFAWGQFCADRLAQFRAAQDRVLGVHGQDVVAALDAFYSTMVELFDGGNMGGVRLVARKAG